MRLATRQPTLLWGHLAADMQQLATDRENRQFLPGIPFPEQLTIEPDLAAAVAAADDLLLAVPSHAMREVLEQLKPLLADTARIAWATKGLEHGSGKFMSEVFEEVLGDAYPSAVASGPSFALEVARGLPTALTVASSDAAFAADMAARLHGDVMRAYTSDDMLGVQLGGTVKNVLAIAAGITDGMQLGANCRAALITRGLAEIMRLGDAMGAQRETLMGLAGVGDLILTCTDDLSRNRRLGLALGRGTDIKSALDDIGQVVEGFNTAREVMQLAHRYQVEMPIAEQVYRVLNEDLSPRDAARNLLSRDLRAESVG